MHFLNTIFQFGTKKKKPYKISNLYYISNTINCVKVLVGYSEHYSDVDYDCCLLWEIFWEIFWLLILTNYYEKKLRISSVIIALRISSQNQHYIFFTGYYDCRFWWLLWQLFSSTIMSTIMIFYYQCIIDHNEPV